MTYISLIKIFCDKHNISPTGICAFTFQKNKTALFSSIIIDWNQKIILDNYPLENLSSYLEMKVENDVLLCYQLDLPQINSVISSTEHISFSFPCCQHMSSYCDKRLDKEKYYFDFKNNQGSHDNVVFEVKRQVNNGPLLDTTFFKIINGSRIKVSGNYTRKIHAFKNYRCLKCNLFFSIDLYYDSNSTIGYNYHHMRLHPFTKNIDTLPNFL